MKIIKKWEKRIVDNWVRNQILTAIKSKIKTIRLYTDDAGDIYEIKIIKKRRI